MKGSILIGLDGPAHADALADLGIGWARRAGGTLVGLAIVDEPGVRAIEPAWPVGGKPDVDPVYYRGYEGRLAELDRQADQLLDQFGARCKLAGVPHAVLKAVGSPHELIELHAQNIGWILADRYEATRLELIPDFAKFPELRWLNKYHLVPPITLGVLCFLVGGWPGLVWGYCMSTVLLWHSSFTINSLSHIFGRQRYVTPDTSKNNPWLALLTMGEGWHNNHHHYMASVRQGFFWWEVDMTYYILKILSWFHIVWDLRLPPAHLLEPQTASATEVTGD